MHRGIAGGIELAGPRGERRGDAGAEEGEESHEAKCVRRWTDDHRTSFSLWFGLNLIDWAMKKGN